MKTINLRWRTLQAMGLGLALSSGLAVATTIAVETVAQRPVVDLINTVGYVALMAAIVSAFAMAGWVLVVWPLTYLPGVDRVWGHPALTEVVWILLALLAFGVVVMSWTGLYSGVIAWIPALIGLCVGLSYRWLGRKKPWPAPSPAREKERKPIT